MTLAEVLALRTLFLSLQFRQGPLTEAEMRGLIERADMVKGRGTVMTWRFLSDFAPLREALRSSPENFDMTGVTARSNIDAPDRAIMSNRLG